MMYRAKTSRELFCWRPREPREPSVPGSLSPHRRRVLAARSAPPRRLYREPTMDVSTRVWGTVYLSTMRNKNQWSGHRGESAQEVSSLPCPSLRRSSQRAATSGGHLGLVNFGSSCAKYPPLSLKNYVMCTRVALLHHTLTPNFPLYTYIFENLISRKYPWWREPLLNATHSLCMYLNGQTLYTRIIDSNKAINTSMWG